VAPQAARGATQLLPRESWLSIPVNVTVDSGNVTGIPANVTEGWCCAFLILCRLAFPAVFPPLELNCF
jgi:hypothetical protein